VKLTQLKKKRVINIYNGNLLGYIKDVIVSFPNGNIETLIIKKFSFNLVKSFFSLNGKLYVSWNNIVSIGKDVILVNIIDN
jgi:YlmC/YmxH family sporulation protein